MSDFHEAIKKTLNHEGGYQNDPKDWANWRGGKDMMQKYLVTKDSSLLVNLIGTKYGITTQDMPELNTAQMRALTPEQATAYYQEHYWKTGYSQIDDQSLGEKLFDMGVLMGVQTAVRLLQISMQNEIQIVSDGEFGPETLSDVNQHGNLQKYRNVLIQHAINIVNNNPNEEHDMNGWITRINS